MNKELEETINKLWELYELSNKKDKCDICIKNKSLETVLLALENSIPKEVIEKKIEEMDKIIQDNKGHKHTIIEASIVKNELQKLLEGKKQ